MAQSKPQNYSNHRRFVPVFHFFALPILGLLLPLYAAVHIVRHPGLQSLVLIATSFALAALCISARIFALTVQDRIIVLEDICASKRFRSRHPSDRGELSDDQIIGLRFSSDNELSDLVKKAVEQNLSRDQIKQAVQQLARPITAGHNGRTGQAMTDRAVNLAEKFRGLNQLLSPQIVVRLNDYDVKIVRIKGDFVWHRHEETDELFLVLEGNLRIDLRDGCVTLSPESSTWSRAASNTSRSPRTNAARS